MPRRCPTSERTTSRRLTACFLGLFSLTLLVWTCAASGLQAQGPDLAWWLEKTPSVQLNTENRPVRLPPSMAVLDDPRGTLTARDALDTSASEWLHPGSEKHRAWWDRSIELLSKDRHSSWMLFRVQGDSQQDFVGLLTTGHVFTLLVDLYEVRTENGKASLSEPVLAGLERPNPQRELFHRHLSIPFNIERNSTHTFLVRVTDDARTTHMHQWEVLSADGFRTERWTETLLYMAIAMVMLTLALYHLCVFVPSRDPSYLYLGLALLGLTWTDFALSGVLGNVLLSGHAPWLRPWQVLGALPFSLACLSMLTTALLDGERLAPRSAKLSRQCSEAMMLVALLSPWLSGGLILAITLPISLLSAFIPSSVMFKEALKSGLKHPRYCLAGFTVFLIACYMYTSYALSLTSTPTLLYQTGLAWGSAGMSFLFSLGLGERVRYERQQRMDAQNEALAAHETALQVQRQASSTLKFRVEERTQQLREQSESLRRVLDNVGQGFMSLLPDGSLEGERSAIVDQWLGPADNGVKIWDYLKHHDPGAAEWMAECWLQISLNVIPLDVCLLQMPSGIRINERDLRLEYRPVQNHHGELERTIVILTDITSQLARDRAETSERELFNLFQRIRTNRRAVIQFFDECHRLVNGLLEPSQSLSEARRALHTLKGNAAAFGTEDLHRVSSQLEEEVTDQLTPPDHDQLLRLQESWNQVEDRLSQLLSHDAAHCIEIPEAELSDLLRALHTMDPDSACTERVHRWLLQSSSEPLNHLAQVAQQLAVQLEKADLHVEVEHNHLRLPADRWGPLWASMIHVVRNALDHGIETSEQRLLAGKSPAGHLFLRSRLVEGEFSIEVEDDGRGIDWTAVTQKASARGLPSENMSQLRDALFQDGLSTRSEAGEISGRGVGMGAAREACIALGGRVEVTGKPGLGTCFRFIIPRAGNDHHSSLASRRASLKRNQTA